MIYSDYKDTSNYIYSIYCLCNYIYRIYCLCNNIFYLYSWKDLYNRELLENKERKLLYIPPADACVHDIIPSTMSVSTGAIAEVEGKDNHAVEQTQENMGMTRPISVPDTMDYYSSNILWSDLTIIYVDIFQTFGDPSDDSVYNPGLMTDTRNDVMYIANRALDNALKTELLYLVYRLQIYGATISLHLHTKVTHIITINSLERKAVIKVIGE